MIMVLILFVVEKLGYSQKTEAQGLYSRKKAQNTQKSTTYIELLAGKRQSRM